MVQQADVGDVDRIRAGMADAAAMRNAWTMPFAVEAVTVAPAADLVAGRAVAVEGPGEVFRPATLDRQVVADEVMTHALPAEQRRVGRARRVEAPLPEIRRSPRGGGQKLSDASSWFSPPGRSGPLPCGRFRRPPGSRRRRRRSAAARTSPLRCG